MKGLCRNLSTLWVAQTLDMLYIHRFSGSCQMWDYFDGGGDELRWRATSTTSGSVMMIRRFLEPPSCFRKRSAFAPVKHSGHSTGDSKFCSGELTIQKIDHEEGGRKRNSKWITWAFQINGNYLYQSDLLTKSFVFFFQTIIS